MAIGTVYLAGSGDERILRTVVASALATAATPARVAVSYAAVAGSKRGVAHLQRGTQAMFPGSVVTRFAVAGETDAMPESQARRIIDDSDLIFLSGGDPALGAKVLAAAGAADWLRRARARGAALVGVSAGSIMLGAWWAEWPEDEGDAAGTLVSCTAVVPDLVVDCHDEQSDWEELRLVARLLEEQGETPRLYGIPAGGALVIDAEGRVAVEGSRPFVLPRSPN